MKWQLGTAKAETEEVVRATDELLLHEENIEFPHEDEEQVQSIKQVLKSTRAPYPRFDGYYRLEDIID